MRRVAARLLIEAYARDALGARPGLILFVQTFGDLAKFNPHVHVLTADGATYLTAGMRDCDTTSNNDCQPLVWR